MKPLLVFGLRGTLVERLHVRNIPSGMRSPDLSVGLTKVWLRPYMLETLLALQPHCRLAIWSSTTRRNTLPLVDAVFNCPQNFESVGVEEGINSTPSSSLASPSSGNRAGPGLMKTSGGERFSKRRPPSTEDGTATVKSPLHFEFVWSREHTAADDFRRINALVHDDSHATVKDISHIFEAFPHLAQPEQTVLIDDTPSKAKLHAANFLWLDTCEGLRIDDTVGMRALSHFVMDKLLHAKDVRDVLPHRIRGGNSTPS